MAADSPLSPYLSLGPLLFFFLCGCRTSKEDYSQTWFTKSLPPPSSLSPAKRSFPDTPPPSCQGFEKRQGGGSRAPPFFFFPFPPFFAARSPFFHRAGRRRKVWTFPLFFFLRIIESGSFPQARSAQRTCRVLVFFLRVIQVPLLSDKERRREVRDFFSLLMGLILAAIFSYDRWPGSSSFRAVMEVVQFFFFPRRECQEMEKKGRKRLPSFFSSARPSPPFLKRKKDKADHFFLFPANPDPPPRNHHFFLVGGKVLRAERKGVESTLFSRGKKE